MKFFKIIILICVLYAIITLCSCSMNRENADGEINAKFTTEITPESALSETVPKEEEPSQTESEKEYGYLRSLEDLELDRDKIKQIEGKELSNTDFTECSVAVLSPYSEKIIEHLSEEDIKYFIDCIAKADTSSEEYEVTKTNGGSSFSFQITLKTGEQIYIGTSVNDLLVINMEHGYMCNEESIDKIRKFYNEVYNGFLEKVEH